MTDLQFKPLVVFNSETDTGVDEIPLNSLVQVNDWSGSQKLIQFISTTGLNSGSTVNDLIQYTNYKLIQDDGAGVSQDLELYTDDLPQLGANLIGGGNVINNVIIDSYEDKVNNPTIVSGAFTLDCRYKFTEITLTEATTMEFSNVPSGSCSVYLEITNSGLNFTFPYNVKWDDLPPDMDMIGAQNIIKFQTVDSGVNWYGVIQVGQHTGSWDITSITYDTVGVAAQDLLPIDLIFKPDGTVLYELGADADKIYQHTLSTPWDITSITYDTVGVATQDTLPIGLFFKPDGTVMYEVGSDSSKFYSHTLSTPWDITSITLDTVGVATQDSSPSGMFFKPDGTVMYELGSNSIKFYQHTLSTPWDITSITLDTVGVATQDVIPFDLFFKPDGTVLYEVGAGNDKFFSNTLSTPWDITSITYDTVGVAAQDASPSGMFFKPDGTVLYELGYSGNKFYSRTLT